MTKTFFKQITLIGISYLLVVLFLIFFIFQMVGHLTGQEWSKVAARYEVWKSIVEVQRFWRALLCKADDTGSVNDARRISSAIRQVENFATVQKMFNCRPQKSTRQAARESELTRHTRHTRRSVLQKNWIIYRGNTTACRI